MSIQDHNGIGLRRRPVAPAAPRLRPVPAPAPEYAADPMAAIRPQLAGAIPVGRMLISSQIRRCRTQFRTGRGHGHGLTKTTSGSGGLANPHSRSGNCYRIVTADLSDRCLPTYVTSAVVTCWNFCTSRVHRPAPDPTTRSSSAE